MVTWHPVGISCLPRRSSLPLYRIKIRVDQETSDATIWTYIYEKICITTQKLQEGLLNE